MLGLVAALLPLGIAGGCASPGAQAPRAVPITAVAANQTFATGSTGATLAAAPAPAWPADRWWEAYGDPQLTALIDEGLANAPDVAMAAARFRKAEGLAGVARGALLPTLDVTGSVAENKISYNQGYPPAFLAFLPHGWNDEGQIAASLGFDPDIWGENRARLAAARDRAQAAAVDAAAAKLALASGIASAYADFAGAVDQRDIAQARLANRTQAGSVENARNAHGLDDAGALHLAEVDTANAQADLAAANRQLGLSRDALAALVGAGPDRGLTLTDPRLTPATLDRIASHALPADVSIALIARRPDIAAARARVEAANADARAAHAQFFPAIKLSALAGYQSVGLGSLLDPASTFGNIGPAVTLPIFHGGAIRAQYRGARADADAAIAAYNATVITGYRQAADAVVTRDRLGEQMEAARAALDASEKALAIATARRDHGLANALEWLAADARHVQAQSQLSQLQTAMFRADIDLVRALGGGFASGADLAAATDRSFAGPNATPKDPPHE